MNRRKPRRGSHARIVRAPAARLVADLKMQIEAYRRREFDGLSPDRFALGHLIDTVEVMVHHICDNFDERVRDEYDGRDVWQGIQARSARELQRHAAIVGVGQTYLADGPTSNPVIAALLSSIPLTDILTTERST